MLLALPTPSLFFIACGKCCLHCLRLFKPPPCFLLDCSGSIIASCFKSWAWVTCMCDCTAFVWKGEKGGGGEAQFCILALLPIVAVSLQAASILDSGLHAYVIVLPLSGGGRGGGQVYPLAWLPWCLHGFFALHATGLSDALCTDCDVLHRAFLDALDPRSTQRSPTYLTLAHSFNIFAKRQSLFFCFFGPQMQITQSLCRGARTCLLIDATCNHCAEENTHVC